MLLGKVYYSLLRYAMLYSHSRGTKEILSDYLPQIFSTKAVTTTALYVWTGISALTFLGLAYLNIYDVGVCKAVAMLWKL